jgi:gliding motility-associated-like protein
MQIKKFNFFAFLITSILFGPLSFAQQCACNTGCTMTIDSAYNGNLNLAPYDKVCITANGYVKGNIYLAWNSSICNSGKIYGDITVEGKDCNGCGDENRLCNYGEIFFKTVTPGIHTRWHNYGIIHACGDIPGPKSFTINNYPGACLDVKGKYSLTPGVSSWSILDGSVTLGSFDVGSVSQLDIKGSMVVKGSFVSSGSAPIKFWSGACVESGTFTQGSSVALQMQTNTSLKTGALTVGSGGITMAASTCLTATAITNVGAINVGANSTITGTSLTSSNTIILNGPSTMNISGKITLTGAAQLQVGGGSYLGASDIDLQAAAKLNGIAGTYGRITVANDITWCCGTNIIGNLDVCISNNPAKKKVSVGGQVVGPAVTWCATAIAPTACTVVCPTHVTCPWTCCMNLDVTGIHADATCANGTNGTITINYTGGTGPYTYKWNDGVATLNRTGLAPGSYQITIMDKDSCLGVKPLNIYKQPCGPTVTAIGSAICKGGCATVVATPGGIGNPPYSYVWTGGLTGATQSFCPTVNTSYTVTLTDATSQTSTDVATITINPLMTLTPSGVNPKCTGSSTGSASVVVASGTPGFTYNWSPSGGTGSTTTSTLAAGTYIVTVTDSKGCTLTTSTTITDPPPVTGTPSSTVANCGTANGTASVVPGGGTGPYKYLWASGSTAATISGIGAGSYVVTVTDSKNCTATTTANVNSTGGVTASILSSQNATCVTPGNAVVKTTGGTAAFTYSWSPSGGTAATASNLGAGTYTVAVTDANGCISNTTVTITISPNPLATTSKVDDHCAKGQGSVTVTPTAGTSPYTYLWSPGGATTATAGNLLAGNYVVTVTDVNGCTATSTAVVANISGPTATTQSTNSTCFGSNNGTAKATPAGGTGAYTYNWLAGGSTAVTIGSLSPGTYTVTVTDAAGCTITSTAVTTEPPKINVSVGVTNAACGATDGTASVTASSGGTGTLTYSWTPGGSAATTITALAAGTYTVLVTDATGCTTSTTALVNSTGGVTANIQSHLDATCVTPGNAVVNTTGGLAPFTYSWSPSGGTAATANNLLAGTYTVVVTDANNCLSNTTVTITVPAGPQATTTKVDDNCGKGIGSVTVTATVGTPAYTYAWNSGGSTTNKASNLIAGGYTVTVTDVNGCTITATATVNDLNGPSATKSSTNITCFGANNGTAQVNATGGAGGYNYTWSPSSNTTASISGLSAGTYTVTVSDAAGCVIISNVTITEPPKINIVPAVVDANCGSANGSITITPSGGVGPYTPTWSPGGGPGFTSANMSAGSYTVTVTDGTGCTTTSGVVVSNVGAPSITVAQVNVLCKGGNNGSATITITGGAPGYNIVWTPVALGTGTTINSLTAGSYTVAVTDANNCVQNTIVIITEPPALTATAIGVSPNCPGGGTTSVTPGGGTPGYTYNWMSGGASTQTVTGLATGIYSITVTDANGCTQTSTTSITVPPALVLTATPVDGTCGLNNGSVSLNPSGGTPGYNYTWLPSGAGQTATGLAANTYTITMSDAKGCTQTTTAIVGNSPPVTLTAVATNVSCNGGNDGSATATPVGGTVTITYAWSPAGGTGAVASGLIAGTYTVNVIDSKGCIAQSTVAVTEPPVISLSAPAVGKICIGQNATLTATPTGGTPAYTIAWTPGTQTGPSISVSPVVTTNYTVAVVDSKGCTTSSTVIVNVNPPLTVNATGGKPVCPGASTTISALAGGGNGNYTYSWLPGNTTGATVTVTPVGVQTYTVTVSDDCGTPVATSTVVVQSVNPLLIPTYTPDSTTGCAPLSVTFTNTTTGGVIKSCLWDLGDGNTSTNCAPTYTYRKPGVYSVKLIVTDTNGCTSTITKTSTVKVWPVPVAAFTLDPKSTSVLEPLISFTDHSSPDVVKWNWTFGDVYNSGSTKKNPTYSYKDTGTYHIELLVTNQYGCIDTVTDVVYIHGDYTLYVPNAFSPNGDGRNETFFPKGFMIWPPCFHMMIFDRWGNLIWETRDLNQGWDGKANSGELVAQQDVYVWKIETCDYRKKIYKYIGHVTLVK